MSGTGQPLVKETPLSAMDVTRQYQTGSRFRQAVCLVWIVHEQQPDLFRFGKPDILRPGIEPDTRDVNSLPGHFLILQNRHTQRSQLIQQLCHVLSVQLVIPRHIKHIQIRIPQTSDKFERRLWRLHSVKEIACDHDTIRLQADDRFQQVSAVTAVQIRDMDDGQLTGCPAAGPPLCLIYMAKGSRSGDRRALDHEVFDVYFFSASMHSLAATLSLM